MGRSEMGRVKLPNSPAVGEKSHPRIPEPCIHNSLGEGRLQTEGRAWEGGGQSDSTAGRKFILYAAYWGWIPSIP